MSKVDMIGNWARTLQCSQGRILMHGLTILGLHLVSQAFTTRNVGVSLGWCLRRMELALVGHDAPHLIKGLVLVQIQSLDLLFVGSPFRRLRIPDRTVLGGPFGL